jgi:Helicase conserved C-terminal domain
MGLRVHGQRICARPLWITSREQGRIMIATEAGAEGINLQFCSLVVNYDLPWKGLFSAYLYKS